MALAPGSPAINAGDNTNAPEWDQRGPGFPRIYPLLGGIIDIGAYECHSQDCTIEPSRTPNNGGRALAIVVAAISQQDNANMSRGFGSQQPVHELDSVTRHDYPAETNQTDIPTPLEMHRTIPQTSETTIFADVLAHSTLDPLLVSW